MSKVMISVIGFILLLIVGAGTYFVLQSSTNRTDDATPSENTSMTAEETDSDGQFSGTFAELLSLGQDYSCSFDTTDDDGNRTVGTAYVASGGNKLNGEFSLTQANGDVMDGNVIRDGEYNYIWTSLEETGYKTKVSAEDVSIFGSGSEESETGLSDTDNVDFDCAPWNVENSMFVPPTNIEFVDFSAAMMEIGDTEDATRDIDCSVCDQVPAGSAKDQCLATLGC